MERPMSSSGSLSSLNHGLIQQNVEPSTVGNVGAGPMLEETHPEQINHMTTSSSVVTLELSTSHEDAEIDVDHVRHTSSLDRNAELPRRNVRQRMNPATEEDFPNSSLSSVSPVDSSQLSQPFYLNWVTSPRSTNSVRSHFIASNGGYAFRRQDNSQDIPRSTSMQSMLVPGTERGNSSSQLPMTSRVVPSNYNSQNGASAAPEGAQLSHPLGFPQQNTVRSSPSSSTNGVPLPSVMRSAGIGSGGQVRNQIPPPSSAAVAMMDLTESRFGNGRALQPFPRRNDGMPISFPPLQVSAGEARARFLRTLQRVFDILDSAGAFAENEGVMTANGPQFSEEEPDVHENMRLDVDDMSYEDLLALEEHIGNVGTGMAEESILGALRRFTYRSMTVGPPVEEMCVICQEQYADCDEQGKLDCDHLFHFNCVKNWLTYKKSCPICKKTALVR